jgi:hypothetical protein
MTGNHEDGNAERGETILPFVAGVEDHDRLGPTSLGQGPRDVEKLSLRPSSNHLADDVHYLTAHESSGRVAPTVSVARVEEYSADDAWREPGGA